MVKLLLKLSSDQEIAQRDLDFLSSVPVTRGLRLLASSPRFVEDRRNLALLQVIGGSDSPARATRMVGLSALILQIRFGVVRKGTKALLRRDFNW